MQQNGPNDVAAALNLIASITDVIKNLTLTGALIYVIWGGKQGWWVYGWVYQAKSKSEEFYRELVFKLLGLTGENVEVIKTMAAAQSLRDRNKDHP